MTRTKRFRDKIDIETTPVKKDKDEKNTILTKQEDGLQRATSQCLRNEKVE